MQTDTPAETPIRRQRRRATSGPHKPWSLIARHRDMRVRRMTRRLRTLAPHADDPLFSLLLQNYPMPPIFTDLMIYNYRMKLTERLTNAETTRRYSKPVDLTHGHDFSPATEVYEGSIF
jgi:hypothetical protein